jgi:hypothetical protein
MQHTCSAEQIRFYGRLLPSGTISLLRAHMTATAIMFTASGFALAADGNQLRGRNHFPDLEAGETNCAQKIFGAEGKDFAIAYIVRGVVANEHRTFDASVELPLVMSLLARKRFANPRELIDRVANGLGQRMWVAIKSGYLPWFLDLQIPLVGYFRNEPFYLNLNSYSSNRIEIIGQAVYPGLLAFSGSPVIARMIETQDPRIASMMKWPYDDPSLEDAVMATRSYIEICSSTLGLEVDQDNCRGLGGHIHVATVALPLRPSWFARTFGGRAKSGGFEWIVPPQLRSSLL